MDGLDPTSPMPGQGPSDKTETTIGHGETPPTMSSLDGVYVGEANGGGESPSSATPTDPPGAGGPFPHDFGRYRLLDWLGGGGMGGVYLTLDRKLEIQVALKVPKAELAASPRVRELFHRELREAARLLHPGLAWVLDVGQVDDIDYLVMRYVAGTPLSHYPSGTPRETAAMIREVAMAMTAAHREGVIHRDLKPPNIVMTPEGCSVVIDFGLAVSPDDLTRRPTDRRGFAGTPAYASPEQLRGDARHVGPQSDIFALGVVLYERLARRLPFPPSRHPFVSQTQEAPPSSYRVEVDPALDAICLKALACEPGDRYPSMAAFAADLYAYLERDLGPALARRPRAGPGTSAAASLRRDVIRFAFVGPGTSVPKDGAAPDRLFLDVGNDLRPGVVDHHQLQAYGGSTARLVVSNPDLVAGAVQPHRDPGAPFTIVLHEVPDFDSAASAYLAIAILTTGEFPAGTEALTRYADKVDEGSAGHTLNQPFSLYAAYMQLLNRHARLGRPADHAYWRDCVQQGLDLIAYALDRSLRDGVALPSVDAFACPERFDEADRRDVLADVERYRRKLDDPKTCTRIVELSLPGQFGGRVKLDALVVRDVQNLNDLDGCIFFKDWARSDRARAPSGEGFLALSVFMAESPRNPRRCILSVTPDSGASLRSLGALLDEAESERRRQVYGDDDRVVDPATGARKPPRAGYDNADPWYDGRAHGFTIVDSPRSGTVLTAEEIEGIFGKFGGLS